MSERASVQESLLQAFRDEFQHDLALIRGEWERYTPDRRTKLSDLEELRRALHTIKGSTRLLGFQGLPEQVHALEEMVLEALDARRKPVQFWDGLADLEEAVSQALGLGEVSLELLDVEPAPLPTHGLANGTSTGYGFLLAVDELVSMGEQLSRELDLDGGRSHPSAHQAALLVERSRALRDLARRMALVPSSELFAGLTELARRTAGDQGKTVSVIHQVAPDQLERDMVLALRPALLHLVANAVVHGVEGDTGVLSLSYKRRPSELVVGVGDNGRGLSRPALKEAVVGAGHLSAAQWDALGEAQQLQWIFHPGLSTRSKADLSAGRGMGMAVVEQTVRRLGGRVEIESAPGKGTEFRLLLPGNWNLRSVLKVSSGGHDFAVLRSELTAVQARALEKTASRPLGELSALLGYAANIRQGAYRLIFTGPGGEVAVGVDELGEFEHVLVTPLLGYGGLPAAIIGVTPQEGQALPVISLQAVAESPSAARTADAPTELSREGPLLLVVDDSVTTRTLVTGILDSAGYRLLVASDGREALDKARSEPELAAIVSDYQMPVMDGLEFLEALRADETIAAVPFILLTSIDDVATFEKASGLGADRCLGKQNFTQDLLLKTVRELL